MTSRLLELDLEDMFIDWYPSKEDLVISW
jgi:hypothetical protein